MIADLEFTFSQHEERIRRAEKQYTLIEALRVDRSSPEAAQARRRLTTLLRRIAGTAATA